MRSRFKILAGNLLLVCVLVVIAGCSASQEKTKTRQVSASEEEISIYKDLASKYRQLFKQNVELRKMLQNQQEQNQVEKEQTERKIKNLTNTIALLELNLKQTNAKLKASQETQSQISAAKPEKEFAQQPAPRNDVPDASPDDEDTEGLSADFQTPEDSRAIKKFSLLPSANHSETRDQSLPKQKTDRSTQPKVPPKPGDKNESPQSAETEAKSDGSEESIFYSEKAESSWEDPDLTPPKSPIQLKVVPGAKRQYQEAFKTYSSRDFKEAIVQFQTFLERYPSDMDADNSQYWIGQCQYHLDDLMAAEHSFRNVLRNYAHKETKKGYKTPDAILMLGRIYLQRNQPVKSRYYFQEVMKRFPDSRSAAKAKREIQAMTVF